MPSKSKSSSSPGKKKAATEQADLKAQVKKLRSKLERAEASKERWKRRATELKTGAAPAASAPKPAQKTAPKAAAKTAAKAPAKRAAKTTAKAPVKAPAKTTAKAPQPSTGGQPDASWTVLQLRAEARSRGVTGLSGKSKAQLLSALQ